MINRNFIILLMLANINCLGQNNGQMKNKNNPLLCDPGTGVCETPASTATQQQDSIHKIEKPLKLIYFTDPICSSCWGIEPQLRKLKLEYGGSLEIEYRMGGLLPDWSYNSGGISKPSDVAHHWDEVSIHYNMPIDGDIWLEDPLSSSYPPSIAFKAAQIQDKEKAVIFLRELREMVFLQKKNITKWEHLAAAAQKSGLDTNKLKADFEKNAVVLFQEDLKLAKEWGVRGFPSIFLIDGLGGKEFIYGTKPYTVYEVAISKLYPSVVKDTYYKDWISLFSRFSTLTAKEFSELSGMPRDQSEQLLTRLSKEGKLTHFTTKNGAVWQLLQ